MAGTSTAPQGQSDGAAAQAQQKAQEVAGQAKEQAQQAAGQAKSQLRTQVDQRSTQAGEQVSSTASDVRSVSETLREQGKDKPAELADKAATQIEKVGSYLTGSDADRILHDVEDFARQRPWAVVAGGAALGFAASRFLKASSTQRYSTRTQGLPNTYARPAATTPPPLAGEPNTLSGGVAPTPGTTPRFTGTGTPPPATGGGL
jgi:ElaB/YqjD/DUF883 family membrane-anchored ribosome-binding protein